MCLCVGYTLHTGAVNQMTGGLWFITSILNEKFEDFFSAETSECYNDKNTEQHMAWSWLTQVIKRR